jgi:soluble lytic murein transglycosylase
LKIILFFIFSLSVFANEITLQYLKNQPKSYARDFYIYQFLQQDISLEDANDALKLVKSMKGKMVHLFAKKSDDANMSKKSYCYKLKTSKFINEDSQCIKWGLSIRGALKLNNEELETIIKNIEDELPKKAKVLQGLLEEDTFEYLTSSPTDIFFNFFNNIGMKYRRSYLNKEISLSYVKEMIKNTKMNRFLELIIPSKAYDNLKRSLVHKLDTSKLSAKSIFFLALNALNHQNRNLSLHYLDLAKKKAYYRFDKDKAVFWKYLITKKKKYLYELKDSKGVNIYVLLALDKLNLPYPKATYNIKCKNIKDLYDIQNPFMWVKLLDNIKSMDKKDLDILQTYLTSCDTLPQKAFILERLNGFNKHYFIKPYYKYIRKLSIKEKSFLLSIAVKI